MSEVKSASVQENKMGTMPIAPLLASVAIPVMISMLVQALYNVVDSIFVARLSQDALNAVSLAFPLQNLMIAVGSGTGVGMNALLSRCLGEKNQDGADRVANTGVFLYLCSAVVFALIGIFLAKPFFLVQTANETIIRYGVDYTRVCLVLSFGMFLQFCWERQLQSTGRTFYAMCTQLAGALINIVLDPILIFGYFGMPRMEVAGAAVATVAGQLIASLIGCIICIRYNKDVHLRASWIRFHKDTAAMIYKIAVPSILMMSISSILTFGLNKILIGFTEAATAVYGIYFKLQNFIFMPVFGLNNGMVPIISYNYGAARMDRVKKTIVLAIGTAMTIMLCGMLMFETMPTVLLGLFAPTEEMLRIGTVALRIIGLALILAGFDVIAGSVCQAIGNPVHSLIISVTRQLVVLLPAAYLLSRTGRLELVWLAFPIAEFVAFLLSINFLRQTLKRAHQHFAADMDN
jgi:putative MATE family efflux protein